MEYLNRKQNLTFEVQAFTGVKSLLVFAEQNRIEILLISEAAVCREVREAGCGKADRSLQKALSLRELGAYAGVYKYQSSAQIVREVMACYGEERSVLPCSLLF